MLCELLKFAGVPVAPAPTSLSKSGVFLTNAALCLKVGGAQAEVKKQWFLNCGLAFLRAQVQLVQPTVVVSLGEQAYLALRHAFALPRHSFRRAANRREPIPLPTTNALLVPVYHCGQRILHGHRKRPQQFEDWALVKSLLSANHKL
jgi:uracil-DNA glycosylase